MAQKENEEVRYNGDVEPRALINETEENRKIIANLGAPDTVAYNDPAAVIYEQLGTIVDRDRNNLGDIYEVDPNVRYAKVQAEVEVVKARNEKYKQALTKYNEKVAEYNKKVLDFVSAYSPSGDASGIDEAKKAAIDAEKELQEVIASIH